LGKIIRNERIKHLRRKNELEALYMYEILYELERQTTAQAIKTFFIDKYNQRLDNQRVEELEVIFKRNIKRLRIKKYGKILERNYQSHEIGIS
jgi:hypothetical protein